jgi:PAS domain S-box-containing protein
MQTGSDVDEVCSTSLPRPIGLEDSPWSSPLISEVLESLPDPVIGLDTEGHVVYWSKAARDAYGYSSQEALGHRMTVLLQTRLPKPLMEIMEDVTDLGRWHGRLVHRTKAGHHVAVESRWVARYDDAGVRVGGFGIERPVPPIASPEPGRTTPGTHGRVGAESRAEGERQQTIALVARDVGHEFNNALAIIINYASFVGAELARLSGAPTESQLTSLLQDVAEISTAGERAAQLTQQLMTFALHQAGPPQPVDLNATIRGLEPVLTRTVGDHIRVNFKLAPELAPVTGDPSELQQVMVNLVVNAREAMPSGGTLTIDTAAVVLDGDAASVSPILHPGAYVRLRISDTGTGMTGEVLERAFEPFFTTKPHSHATGLGLSSVRGIFARMDGHARFFSEPGIGTTFVALLPAATWGQPESAGAPPASAEPAPAAGRPAPAEPAPAERAPDDDETVLVVEGEATLREMERRILADAGYQVLVASSGADALDQAQTHSGAIDLVMTDLVMPGMLGHELAARIRALRPDAEVLYVSGFSESVVEPAAHVEPATVVDTPFTAPALLERVRDALAGHPRSR